MQDIIPWPGHLHRFLVQQVEPGLPVIGVSTPCGGYLLYMSDRRNIYFELRNCNNLKLFTPENFFQQISNLCGRIFTDLNFFLGNIIEDTVDGFLSNIGRQIGIDLWIPSESYYKCQKHPSNISLLLFFAMLNQ